MTTATTDAPTTLITGTSRGIGRYLAAHYCGQGHRVLGTSRSESDFQHPHYRYVATDVTDEAGVKSVFRLIRRECGRLDHLINNAGIAAMNHAMLTPVATARRLVEIDGDYLRILGRQSDVINVGGEKVYPAEVETCLAEMPGVEDVAVTGAANPITGAMVTATICRSTEENAADFRKRMRLFCKGRLPRFKVPQKVRIGKQQLHSGRFKKMRQAPTEPTS